jgi:hypothetical protein
MPWAKFDDKTIRSRKVRRVARKSPQAALLWMFAIIYCCEQQTDGEIEGDELRELLPHHHEDFIKTLVGERMLHDRPGCDSPDCLAADGLPIEDTDMYVIHDFGATQLLRADWEQIAEEKAKKGRFGMHKRWHVNRSITDPECEFCKQDTG